MSIPKELYSLYRGLSGKESLYMKARWLVSPIERIERAVPSTGTVYDIGCGIGLLSNLMSLRSPSRTVVGVDLSEEKIGIARKSAGEGRNISFENTDAVKLRMDSPAAVTICDTLHHIPKSSQESLLKYVHKVLVDGGTLVLQDIDVKPFPKYAFARLVDKVLGWGEPVNYRKMSEWASLLEGIGFEVKAERVDRGYPIAAVLFICVKKYNNRG